MPTNPYGIDYDQLSQLFSGASAQRPGVRRPAQRRGLGTFDPNADVQLESQYVEQDPALELDSLQRQRKAELEDQMARAIGSGAAPPEQEALKFKYQTTNRDIAASPLRAQEAETAGIEKRGKEALLALPPTFQSTDGGYGGAIRAHQEQNRLQELEQVLAPERMQQEGAMAREREQTRRALEVERLRDAGLTERQQSYNELLSGSRGGGPQSMTLPGRYGGGSVNFGTNRQDIPASALTQLTAARGALEAARANEDEQAIGVQEAGYKQALGNLLGQAGIGGETAEAIFQISRDPELSGLSLEEILNHPDVDASDLGEDELAAIRRVWPYIIGGR